MPENQLFPAKATGLSMTARLGIVLVQDITVGENIFIGREPLTKFGFINYKEIYERSLGFVLIMIANKIVSKVDSENALF